MAEETQIKKKVCPVCNRRFINKIGIHLRFSRDKEHIKFYEKQKKFVLSLFKNLKSFKDMEDMDYILVKGFPQKYFSKICKQILGEGKVKKISKQIHCMKRKNYWKSISLNERKKIMEKVREAEWGKLKPEERKNHPWVVAGRIASLKSSKRGSKNQKYAFKLLKKRFPNSFYLFLYIT